MRYSEEGTDILVTAAIEVLKTFETVDSSVIDAIFLDGSVKVVHDLQAFSGLSKSIKVLHDALQKNLTMIQ